MMESYFKFLVQLYPYKFRELYGNEILQVISKEDPSPSIARRFSNGAITTFKTLPWILKENADAFTADFAKTPAFIKFEYGLGILMVAPFFLIVAHNLIQIFLWHRVSQLFITIGNSWVDYTIITPMIAIFLSLAGLAWYMKRKFNSSQETAYEAGVVPSSSLAVIIGTISAALIAIF